jgi:hypothetical protein
MATPGTFLDPAFGADDLKDSQLELALEEGISDLSWYGRHRKLRLGPQHCEGSVLDFV